MFLAIPQISSAYTCFTEVEATEAIIAFSKHVLLTLINLILSIPNSKSQVGKKLPPALKTLKSPKDPSRSAARACDLSSDNQGCAACTDHTSGKWI